MSEGLLRRLLLASAACMATMMHAQSNLIDAQLGTAVVYKRDGHGISAGLGYERALTRKWGLRVSSDYAAARYRLGPGERRFEGLGLAPARTNSLGVGAFVLRTWRLGRERRHGLDAGLGVHVRRLQVRSIVESLYVWGEGDDGDLFTRRTFAEVGVTRRTKVGPAARVAYRYRLGDHLALGAYWRYEPQVTEGNRRYQTFRNESITGGSFGLSNGFLEFLNTQNAMSFGVSVGYAF